MDTVSGTIFIDVERGLQVNQDGILTENECTTKGDMLSCPASANLSANGQRKRMLADVLCPLSATQQSDFRDASQKGLCTCDSQVMDLDVEGAVPEPISCECFICPASGSVVGVAYQCASPIVGVCTHFNCFGTCNGDLNFFAETRAPTAAPMAESTATGSDLTVATTALLLLAIFRMMV